MNDSTRQSVPCRWCGKATFYLGTKECDPCHNVRSVAARDPMLTHRIAAGLEFDDKRKVVIVTNL